MNHLHQAMHACIGTPGAIDPNRLGCKPAQRKFEFVLDCVARELALPALISTAAVCDAERYAQKLLTDGKG